MRVSQLLIGGKWLESSSGETIDLLSPSNGRKIGEVASGTPADIDKAVAAARRAVNGAWGNMPAVERDRVPPRLGERVQDHHEELAQIEAADTGKPLTQARTDVTVCARYFEFYGGAADKLHGDVIPYLDGYQVSVLREPRG